MSSSTVTRPDAVSLPIAPGRRVPIAVFVAALAVRVALLVLVPEALAVGDDYTGRYAAIAAGILRDGAFLLDGVPTAMSPPVYPVFLAALYAVVGDGTLVVRLALAAVDAAQCAVGYVLAWRLAGARGAAVAAVLAVFCPYYFYGVLRVFSEPLFLLLHTGAVVLLLSAIERRDAARFVGVGALFGLAALCRATVLLLPLALVVPVLLRYRGRVRQGLGHWAVLVAAFAVVLAPWTARNYDVFGRWVPVQTLGGYHVAVGSVPEGTIRDGDDGMRDAYRPEADAALFRATWQSVRRDAGARVWLSARRTGDLWFRTTSGSGERLLLALNAVLLGLAAAGMWLGRRRAAVVPLLAVVVYYVAIHSQMVAIFRYAIPLLPILFAFVGVLADRLWARLRPAEALSVPGDASPSGAPRRAARALAD